MDMLVAGASLADTELLLDRRVILPVVRGLMKLLLHANFSCHADLFVLACKVYIKRVSHWLDQVCSTRDSGAT